MSFKLVAVTLFLAGLWNAVGARAAALPPGATVLDPDIVWDIANPHSFAISPDGKQIAYISKGSLWACRVDAGPPSKLADLPNTITAILAEPGNETQRDESVASPQNPGYRAFYGPVHLDKHYVFSLAWTPSQDGVVYTVRKRVREHSMVAAYHVMHVSLTGTVQEIAVIEGEFGVPDEHRTSFYVTPDRKYVVASGYAPLIWDVLAGRPRVTPYDRLLRSAKSGCFIGVEIDTCQLVLVDEDFAIVERYSPTFDNDRRIGLEWSDDERYVVCRTYRPYGSRQWDGFRFDLSTGTLGPQYSGVENDRFVFTGNGGEVVRLGAEPVRQGGRADGSDGSYIAITPNGVGEEKPLLGFSGLSRDPEKGTRRLSYPPFVADHHASMIAMALPRPVQRPAGFDFHLVDRDGHARPFVPASDAGYITPYYPIAFADGGRRLIARMGSTLFSLPVSDVLESDEARDDE